MKRVFVLVLCVALCFGLSACGVSSGISETLINQSNSSPNVHGVVSGSDGIVVGRLTEGEQLMVFENDKCALYIDSAGFKDQDYAVEIVCENRTNGELSFLVNTVSANGWMMDEFFLEDVKPRARFHSMLLLYDYDLDEIDLKSVDKLTFYAEVTDCENWEADPYIKDFFTVYTSEKTESEMEIPEYVETGKEFPLIETEDYRILITEIEPASARNPGMTVYIENRSDKACDFSFSALSINGWEANPYFACSVGADRFALKSVFLDRDVLSACGIKEIDQITVTTEVTVAEDSLSLPETVYSNTTSVYPTGLSADLIPEPARETVEGEQVILDDENLLVIAEPMRITDLGDYVVCLYFHNRSDNTYHATVSDVVYDEEIESDHFRYAILSPDAHCCIPIVIRSYETQTTPYQLAFKLNIQHYADFFADIFSDTIVLQSQAPAED